MSMIGEKIRNMRKAAGMKQDELAAGAGLSQPFLSQVETNKKKPSLDNLGSLAKALNTSVAHIMGEGGADANTSVGNDHGGVGGQTVENV